jgi:methylmalonyl-CoA/ethylmalonyl-CoA epimerase
MIKLNHLGLAVHDMDEALRFWRDALGLTLEGTETVQSEKVRTGFLPAGETRIELLDATGDDSPVARRLAKAGPGVHHIALDVDDLEASLDRLREHGVRILGDGIRSGAGGSKVAFLHPGSCGGVLVELVQCGSQAEESVEMAPGQPVLVYLKEPPEKLWGILRKLDASGVVLEGIDLSSFEDWMAQIENADESIAGPSVLFMPMTRIERILLDRSSGNLPSLADRFLQRVGRSVQEVLGESR